MATQSYSTNNDKNNSKRLTLIKIVRVNLNKENDDETNDDSIEYSPAYIFTTNTCVVNGGAAAQRIQFQLFGKFLPLLFCKAIY